MEAPLATLAPATLHPERLHVVCARPSIANHFLAELRDVQVQTDSLRFRRNLQRLG